MVTIFVIKAKFPNKKITNSNTFLITDINKPTDTEYLEKLRTKLEILKIKKK